MKEKSIIPPIAIFICLILSLSGCFRLPPYRMARKKLFITPQVIQQVENSQEQIPTITVWIHGTRIATVPLITSYMYSQPGLHSMQTLKPCYHLRQLVDALCMADPLNYPEDHVYIFGWSGKLSVMHRKEAALSLYKALEQLIAEYKKKHAFTPRIRLIAHSHGGNVALHMPEMKTGKYPAFKIDELILLACPVQEKTMHMVHDCMFKKIYALYSSLDMLQVLAPQSFYRLEYIKDMNNQSRPKAPLFSSRRLPPDPKLAQIKIKMNGHAVFHTFFTTTKFTSMLPCIMREIDAWQKEKQQYPLEDPTRRRLISIHT